LPFVRAVWDTFLWTGDPSFLERTYAFCKRGLLDWTLTTQSRDGDVLPYGYGVMEMLGLNLQCVDTASLTVEALLALAGMADVLDESDVADRCRRLAEWGQARMEEAFWMESEGLYGDMVATPAEMAPRLQHWMEEAKVPAPAETFHRLLEEAQADPEQERKRPWLLKNWSVLSPLEGRVAPRACAPHSGPRRGHRIHRAMGRVRMRQLPVLGNEHWNWRHGGRRG
jgi:hypothetical protein